MRNFVQKGDIITATAPRALLSGEGFLVNQLFMVATSAAANGATVEGITDGVFELTALSTDTAAVGARAYWDNTNFRVTTTVGSNSLIGVFTVAKTNGQTTATVRLNGVSV